MQQSSKLKRRLVKALVFSAIGLFGAIVVFPPAYQVIRQSLFGAEQPAIAPLPEDRPPIEQFDQKR